MASKAIEHGRPIANWARFLTEYVKSPLAIGSPIATSCKTIEKQLYDVDWARARVFLEYGPGTGEFTRYILERLDNDAQLIAIESDNGLAEHLRESIDDDRLTVCAGSATEAMAILASRSIGQVDYILSGLPFSSLDAATRERIVDDAARMIKDDGQFLVYQVRRTIEPSLRRAFAEVRRQRRWLNLPPYHLFWCALPRRSAPPSGTQL